MCGIVGCAGDLTNKEEGALKQLLIINSLRGIDSTGIAVVPTHVGDVKIAKGVGDVFQLSDRKIFTDAFIGKNKVIIGHGRSATQGSISRKNAHPFMFDKVVGVHNGTLRNKTSIPDHYKFDTDSEALYNHINNVGIDAAMKEINGAYSLVWYNREENTLNFLRNEERPMSFVFTKDKKQLFFASEFWMIQGVCWREKIEIEAPTFLPEHMLYSFKVPVTAFDSFGAPEVRKIKPEEKQTPVFQAPPQVCGTSGGWGKTKNHSSTTSSMELVGKTISGLTASSFFMNANKTYVVELHHKDHPDMVFYLYKGTATEAVEVVNKSGTFSADVVFISYEKNKQIAKLKNSSFKADPDLRNHKGEPITTEHFNKHYSSCSWCTTAIMKEDTFLPISSTEALCPECCQDEEVKSLALKCKGY